MDEKELLKRLRKVFTQEAKERLVSLSTNIINLENETDKSKCSEIMEVVYRDAHSLKGAARSINLSSIETLFQSLESLFNDVQSEQISLTPEILDHILDTVKSVDSIISSDDEIESEESNRMLAEAEEKLITFLDKNNVEDNDNISSKEIEKSFSELISETEPDEVEQTPETPSIFKDKNIKPNIETKAIENDDSVKEKTAYKESDKSDKTNISSVKTESDNPRTPTINSVDKNKNRTKTESKSNKDKTTSNSNDTIRIVASKLDSVLRKSENLILIKQIFKEQHKLLIELRHTLQKTEDENREVDHNYQEVLSELQKTVSYDKRSTRSSISNILTFIKKNNSARKIISQNVNKLFEMESGNIRSTCNMIDEYLSDAKELAMMPFSNILDVFPIMIREISKKLEKKVNFTIKGNDVKIDRRILQEIKDPLIHLIRNSIDHGIENEENRKKINKTSVGKIDLDIFQNNSGKIEIVITDDGSGIDTEKIKEKLFDDNILTEIEIADLTESELLEYIFISGFSTSKIVTELSGRGLGMSIVRDKVEKLGGTIKIINNTGSGTSIILKLPITMATYRGLIIKNDKTNYILPSTLNVKKVVKKKYKSVHSIENKATITVNDKTYPLVDLCDILKCPRKNKEDESIDEITAIIIGKAKENIALKVDEIIEEQDILFKDLGKLMPRVRNISGATILNSGEIVPILNIQDLFESAKKSISSLKVEVNGTYDKQKKKDMDKKNILVVEDSITSRTLLKNILESAGYIVTTAIDGVHGFTELKSSKMDLLVSDIEMPRMNGFDLTAKVRADSQLSEIPIILVTSRSTREDKEKGIEAGANAYIVKSNFDQNNLLDVIDSFL